MRSIAVTLDRPTLRSLGATFAFAALTAVLAMAVVRLPFTPVPVTLQVFGVVLSGLLLGSRLGALAQLQYLTAGLAGAPVFAGGTGGIAAVMGPSGGYIPGFVLGAFLTGLIFERCRRPDAYSAFAAGMVGVAGVYACGVAWLSVWLAVVGQTSGVMAWLLGAIPFIGVDAVKVALAAMVVCFLPSGVSAWRK